MARLTLKDIKHIALLAHLPLTSKLLAILPTQLSKVVDLVNKLQEVDTSTVQPTSQVTGMTNVTREDVISLSLSQKEALSNARRTHKGFFVVDAVFGE